MNTLRSLLPGLLALALAAPLTAADSREAAALAVLSSDADVHAKARACQDLAAFAGPASIPVLAALLDHEHLSDYARSGLESIPAPAAGKALRDALPKLHGRRLAGVVDSLGVRREKAAVPALRALALDPKRGVAAEAVGALGLIGTADAAKVLQQILASGPADLRLPVAHAALVAAGQLAKDGNARAARDVLNAVIRAQPSRHVVAAAENQAGALGGRR
jgi:hypothetical protein